VLLAIVELWVLLSYMSITFEVLHSLPPHHSMPLESVALLMFTAFSWGDPWGNEARQDAQDAVYWNICLESRRGQNGGLLKRKLTGVDQGDYEGVLKCYMSV